MYKSKLDFLGQKVVEIRQNTFTDFDSLKYLPYFTLPWKVNAPLKSKRWSDFQIVCEDWTYLVEEKPLNWKKCKIAYCNCLWFFFFFGVWFSSSSFSILLYFVVEMKW
jgi:hypothetical protein